MSLVEGVGEENSDVMSSVSKVKFFALCSLSLKSKINMYLLHTQGPWVTCTMSQNIQFFTVIYPPPAAHYTLQTVFSNRGVKIEILVFYLPEVYKSLNSTYMS